MEDKYMYLVRVYEDQTGNTNEIYCQHDHYFCAGLYDDEIKAKERLKELNEKLIDNVIYVKADILKIPINKSLVYLENNIDYCCGEYDQGPYWLGGGDYYE